MTVDRMLPTAAATKLLARVHELARVELAPQAAAAEAASAFPRETLRRLGEAGLLGLVHPAELGGGGQPYEVYLQVLEELAAAWMTVGVGVSVHTMSCHALARHGRDDQVAALLPEMISGRQLGAYALSEAAAGSDITGISTEAKQADDGYALTGAKAWITHGSQADFYTTFARTGKDRTGGLSCFLVAADRPGLSFGAPEHKMGLTGSTTTTVYLDAVHVSEDHRLGREGDGMHIALSALDYGRLGIAACATGLAQAALDCAVDYLTERGQLGRGKGSAQGGDARTVDVEVVDVQGLEFLLAEMAAAVDSARATYLLAARRCDAGRPFTRDAAVAKLVATDAAVRVTTDAVQLLGEDGGTGRYPAERLFREAKVTQIFEGTNQIQRLVIARQLLRP